MHISIEAHPIGPLSVISALPDAQLAVLEGLNGIGKSLAVRLLQVCTGQLPYQADSAAWRSFCEGLGPFKVRASNLIGAHEITWIGDSRLWLRKPDKAVVTSFDRIEIDNEQKSIDDVRLLLGVHRIAGDEDILTTFAQQAQAASVTVDRWAERQIQNDSAHLPSLETAIHDVIGQLGDWPLSRLEELLREEREATKRLETDKSRAAQAHARLETLRDASAFSQQLHELRERGPQIRQLITEIDRDIDDIRTKKDQILSEVAEISAKVVVEEPRTRELLNAQRTLTRNRQKLSQELTTASAAAQPLGVKPERQAVDAVIAEAQRQMDTLTAQLTEMDASPMVRDVLGNVTASLEGAEARGLGDQVAIDDNETGVQLTISQTRRGMLARRRFLEERVPPPEMEDIAKQIVNLRRTISIANDVLSRLSNVELYERRVATNEQRVADARAATNPGAEAALRKLEASRQMCDDELVELASRRAALSQQLGSVASGATVAALTEQLGAALREIGIEEAAIAAEFTRADQDNSVAQATVRSGQDTLNHLRRELGKASAEIRAAAANVADAHELSWLRAALGPAQVPRGTDGTDKQARQLDKIRQQLGAVLDRLGAFRVQVVAIGAALQSISKELRGQPPDAQRYVPELEHWLGDDFSRWLSDDRIRRELLPNATSGIRVDVNRAEVTWSEKGQKRSRPLEAFSSGEQAFAYTRARLAVLDDEQPRPANRLIALDEFGSFIAHNRLSQLLAYLSERANEHPGDQVLVILPLSQDYSSQADRATGTDAERLAQWSREVKQRGYLVRTLPT